MSGVSNAAKTSAVEVKLNDGITKRLLRDGEGELARKGQRVTVHYVGKLEDGTEFDSSRNRDEPFEFEIGNKEVIVGWDIAAESMKKGERAILTISHLYAYGEDGDGGTIPPKATLTFDIEVLDVVDPKPIQAVLIGLFQIAFLMICMRIIHVGGYSILRALGVF